MSCVLGHCHGHEKRQRGRVAFQLDRQSPAHPPSAPLLQLAQPTQAHPCSNATPFPTLTRPPTPPLPALPQGTCLCRATTRAACSSETPCPPPPARPASPPAPPCAAARPRPAPRARQVGTCLASHGVFEKKTFTCTPGWAAQRQPPGCWSTQRLCAALRRSLPSGGDPPPHVASVFNLSSVFDVFTGSPL